MGVHLRVAPRLGPLADALAVELARPLADPFTTEVLAVPGDGIRVWLMDHLSRRLGVDTVPAPGTILPGLVPDGVAANIDVVFPATLVSRALAADPEYHEVMSAWAVGPLTWAVHELVQSDPERFGIGEGLMRARSVADLFDRYGLHRVEMVRRWEAGRDVDAMGRPLPESLLWQPDLWRTLTSRLGKVSGPAAMAEATNRLRCGRIVPDLPERVSLFGLASIPTPHLRVLLALAQHAEVEIFIPTWSLEVWKGVRDVAEGSRLSWPIDRSLDPSAAVVRHPLAQQWGRMAREAHLLAASAVAEEPGATFLEVPVVESSAVPFDASQEGPRVSLLHQIQADLRADNPPPGVVPVSPDAPVRKVYDSADVSLTWHRCHGPARQAEVLRDVVRGLLEERDTTGAPRFEPRDIAVLCADPQVFAPLISAAFAADSSAGAPPIPLRIADRSLREESALLTAVGAVLDLLEGRFRAGELLGLAGLDPVRARYGWDHNDLAHLARWVEETSIRWGLDEHHQVASGVPAGLGVHTWRAGLDQLLLGAVMGDRSLATAPTAVSPHPSDDVSSDAVPTDEVVDVIAESAHPGIEGDLVRVVGALAEMISHLATMDHAFAAARTPAQWCEALTASIRQMCTLTDDQAWQWQRYEAQIIGFLADAERVPATVSATPLEMADLFRSRLQGSAGRVRFGTGAVTVTSLTAQRGVPHRVIVICGLDGDVTASTGRAEDLIAAQPCCGDRDPRSELRAQLLDAVMAASDRLILIDTGHNITSNEEVPPAVPVAELADLIDATAVGADPAGPAVSELITLHHPRHGWGVRNFQFDALIPGAVWGTEQVDLEAARARQARQTATVSASRWPTLPSPFPDLGTRGSEPVVISLAELATTLSNPLETYLARRLGVSLPRTVDEVDDLIPLRVGSAWSMRHDLLEARLRAGSQWTDTDQHRWERIQTRRGLVPPLGFGEAALREVVQLTEGLLRLAFAGDGHSRDDTRDMPRSSREVGVDLDMGSTGRVRIEGVIEDVRGHQILEVYPGEFRAADVLRAWLRLMALAVAEPEGDWELTLVGVQTAAGKKPKFARQTLRPADREACHRALVTVVELHLIALCSPVIAPARTTEVLVTEGESAARVAWEGHEGGGSADRQNRWVRYAFGRLDFGDLLALAPTDVESGPEWSTAPSRLERWAQRIWGAVAESTRVPEDDESDDDPNSWLAKFLRKILTWITPCDGKSVGPPEGSHG